MLWQSVKMALNAVATNKMRSFLTMLGIIIGVIALVVLVSIVSSATTSITDEVNSIGNDMLTVSISDDTENPLRLSDMSEFQEDDSISLVAPYTQSSATAKYNYDDVSTGVYGITAAYYDVQGLELQSGRFIKTTDVDNSTYIAVLSYDAAEDIFGSTMNALGETFSLNGMPFRVVGILAEDDSMMSSIMSTATVYIPDSTAARVFGTSTGITSFYVSATDENSIDAAEEAVTELLMNRLKQDEDAFTVTSMSVIADTMSSITGTLSLVLGGIAAISLLVGGIGIMNIMLVSVTERTREIGIRKAIGASTSSILWQFLVESLVLSLMGCLIGVALSWGIIEIVSAVAGDTASYTISGGVVAIAVIFSVGIGVLFGIYPARKAANKNPIEALRFDG